MYLSQKIKKSYSIQVSYTEAFTSQTFIPIPPCLTFSRQSCFFMASFSTRKVAFLLWLAREQSFMCSR